MEELNSISSPSITKDNPTPTEPAVSYFPLPSAIDLAKIAAMVSPQAPAKEAMEKAMEFYIEAFFFLKALPANRRDLLISFGGESAKDFLRQWSENEDHQTWEAGALVFDPRAYDRSDDPFRVYLDGLCRCHKIELHWKKPRTVIENIDGFLQQLPEASHDLINAIKRKVDGVSVWVMPTYLIEAMVIHAKQLRREVKLKSWKKRRSKTVKSKAQKKAKKMRSSAARKRGR